MNEKKELASKKLIQQYKKVFDSPDGRAVLSNLCLANFMYGTTFVRDREETAWNEGHRDAILRILLITKMDPEALMQSVTEEENHV